MNIYVVFYADYDAYQTIGVFSTLELAKAFKASYMSRHPRGSRYIDIDEYPLDSTYEEIYNV